MSAAAEEEEIVVVDERLLELKMKTKLDETDRSNWRIERPTISRVHQQLRDVHKEEYEPKLMSFGPYHRNNSRLAAMAKLKWLYLKQSLARNPAVSLKDYVDEVKRLEPRARSSYSETVEMESDEFVEMMLLDGCFFVEFLLAWCGSGDSDDGDNGGDDDDNNDGDDIIVQTPVFEDDNNDDNNDDDDINVQTPVFEDDNNDDNNDDDDIIVQTPEFEDNDDNNDDDDRNEQTTTIQEMEDTVLNSYWAGPTIIRDMLMLENQLPFFLLETLMNLRGKPTAKLHRLAMQLLKCFSRPLINQSLNANIALTSKPYHFLHLFYIMVTNGRSADSTGLQINVRMESPKSIDGARGNISCLPTEFLCRAIRKLRSTPSLKSSCFEGRVCNTISIIIGKVSRVFVLVFRTLLCCWGSGKESRLDNKIPSATMLQDAGVKFRRKEDPKSLQDITFQSNVLEIPQLSISDDTNCLLRNLIAFEQCCRGIGNQISHYTDFMDSLIDTPEDVEILRHKEIIENNIGNNDNIVIVCNQMGKGVFIAFECSYLNNIIKEVNQFCNKRRNRWRAKLKRDYFSNPWAIISLLAAVFLLILTAVQAVFAPVSYFRPPT